MQQVLQGNVQVFLRFCNLDDRSELRQTTTVLVDLTTTAARRTG